MLSGHANSVVKKEFTFISSDHGWVVDFSDYPVATESFYELSWGWENLPLELQTISKVVEKGLFLSGNNHSDDLFMFAKKRIQGLEPNTSYNITYKVSIITNNSDALGIGGSPGESVYFKAGASRIEPQKINVNGFYRLNVDKGNQATSGRNALVIGNLANPSNPSNFSENREYFIKDLTHDTPLNIKTDSAGNLWVFLGTDSGFEGTTKYYIAKLSILFEEY